MEKKSESPTGRKFVPFERTHKLHRLLFVLVIVKEGQGEAIANLLKENEAYFAFINHGRGTAPHSVLEMMGLADTRKHLVCSVLKEDRYPIFRKSLESRFGVSDLAQGIACAIPLSAIMGVSTYKMLANVQFNELKQMKIGRKTSGKEEKENNDDGKK